MYIKKLKLKNFRCYEDFEIYNINKLAVFIGENDAGKTVLLNAIEWLLSEKPCEDSDCHRDKNGDFADEVSVEGWFQIEEFDKLEKKYLTSNDSQILHIKKTYQAENIKICYFGRGYSDSEFNEFKGAEKQRKLLKKYGLVPEKNENSRKKQVKELITNGKLEYVEREREINKSDYKKLLNQHLPNVHYISAANYKTPDNLIQNKLRNVAKSLLDSQNTDGEIKDHIKSLAKIKKIIERKLKSEIDAIKEGLKKHHQGLKDVNVETEINFENAVGASALKLNLGDGERLLEQFGDGTKRRLWMGLLEWDTEVKNETSSRSVIRLYDEPDVNLHYRAQQQFFENIKILTDSKDIHTQSFISTHSFSMVDRSPSESLILIYINKKGERSKKQLQALPEDKDYLGFMRDLSKAGLSNSALLYESGFLVVEGESEEIALPIFYKKNYQRTLVQDGIKLINLHGTGNWKNILKTLLKTREKDVHFLLDSDCKKDDANGKPLINPKSLAKLNLNENFIEKQVTFIGESEFEDAFSNEVLISTLKNKYPDVESKKWEFLNIDGLRQEGKFSEVILSKIGEHIPEFKNFSKSKPKFAEAVANQCSKNQIPKKIINAFEKIRSQIGIKK